MIKHQINNESDDFSRGSRSAHDAINPELPKPMLKVQGKPLIEHHIERLKRAGITDFVMALRGKAIKFVITLASNTQS